MVELTQAITQSQVYGATDRHIVWLSEHVGVHRDMQKPWQQLVDAASEAGFELAIASGFRSFQRQQTIWERKLAGLLPVLDSAGESIDISHESPLAQAHAILRWSALPGASRHHWGTDVDIFDKAAIPKGYQLQLNPSEYTGDGVFAPLCRWLQEYLSQSASPEFFLPYQTDSGGIAVEPWHISYRPLAQLYQTKWSALGCCDQLNNWQHSHSQVLINDIDALYDRYIKSSLIVPA